MPYLGRTSFLREIDLQEAKEYNCVNALSRAHFISTVKNEETKNVKEMCQCPISGALHFYRISGKLVYQTAVCVNALSRAHFISTPTLKIT